MNKNIPLIHLSIFQLLITLIIAIFVAISIVEGNISSVFILIGGTVVLLTILLRPPFGAALLLAISPLEGITALNRDFTIVKVIALICVVVFAFRFFLTRQGIRYDNTTFIIILFLLWVFATVLWSPDIYLSFKAWFSLALEGLLYLLLFNLVQSKQDLSIAMWGCVIGSVLVAFISMDRLIDVEFSRRSLEGFASQQGINLTAKMVGIGTLISMLLFQLNKRFSIGVLLFVIITVDIISLVILMSRGTWYAMVISVLVITAIHVVRNKYHFPLAQFILLIFVSFIVFYILDSFILSQHGFEKLASRFQSSFTFEDSAASRFPIWKVGWEMFKDSPLFGHGFGSFVYKFPGYVSTSGQFDVLSMTHGRGAHNSFVNVATETGLIGLIIFFSLFVNMTKKIWNLIQYQESNSTAISFGFGILIFLFFACLVDNSEGRKYLWYTLSLITLIVQYFGSDEFFENRLEEQKLEGPK